MISGRLFAFLGLNEVISIYSAYLNSKSVGAKTSLSPLFQLIAFPSELSMFSYIDESPMLAVENNSVHDGFFASPCIYRTPPSRTAITLFPKIGI